MSGEQCRDFTNTPRGWLRCPLTVGHEHNPLSMHEIDFNSRVYTELDKNIVLAQARVLDAAERWVTSQDAWLEIGHWPEEEVELAMAVTALQDARATAGGDPL